MKSKQSKTQNTASFFTSKTLWVSLALTRLTRLLIEKKRKEKQFRYTKSQKTLGRMKACSEISLMKLQAPVPIGELPIEELPLH
jgi:hypothetical protein